MSVAHMHMFTWGSLGKEDRVTPPNDGIYTNKSTQSIWKTKGLCVYAEVR